jgi:hypothetical protein
MYETMLDMLRPAISFVVLTNNEKKTTALTLTPVCHLSASGNASLSKQLYEPRVFRVFLGQRKLTLRPVKSRLTVSFEETLYL